VTSSITNEAVDELGIKVNGCVSMVIKASDVMVAGQAHPVVVSRRDAEALGRRHGGGDRRAAAA
jgi:hypothetical protein